MKQLIALFLISITLFACNDQTKPENSVPTVAKIPGHSSLLKTEEIKLLDSTNIDFQFTGSCYACSSKKNAVRSNGEAPSDNFPKEVDKSFPKNGLYLTINQREWVKIDSTFLGCKLYLVNTTDTLVELNASDSRLYIWAEALNDKKEWATISDLPVSDCGNSYHTVKLDKGEYWSFNIPVFKGAFKTKMRYVLSLGNGKKVASNEMVTYLNKGQFKKESMR